ncbi:MAG: glycosyltransferase family 2 protein [Saprospiraceae bacterium]|nr:glycosyltransferase family 2 protein [Saprospiraceae bacterium]
MQYAILTNNLGRSKIRNQLAKRAAYPYLLFIDCDHKMIHDNYLAQYIAHFHPNKVLYGGTTYHPQPPNEAALHLRWYFGQHREMIAADIRQAKPYHYFMTNNFRGACYHFFPASIR